MPTKNGDRPIDSDASLIEPTRISDITPTATPAQRQRDHALLHRPRLADVVLLGVGGVEEVLVRAQGEDQPGDVGEQQHDRHADRHRLEVVRELLGLLGRVREPAADHQLEDRRHDQRHAGQQQHQRLRVGRRAVERLALALEAADQHRRAHDEQDVAEDRAHQRRLDDLLQALAQREEGDDQLGRVAERHVEEPADAGARRAPPAPRSRGPSAPPSGSRPAPRRRTPAWRSACASSSAIAIGMNGTSRYGQPAPLSRKRRRLKRCSGCVTGAGAYGFMRLR